MTSSIAANKPKCATCEKNTGIFTCGGCNRVFCTKHANEHRQILGGQMDEIVLKHDQLRHNINEYADGTQVCSSFSEINQWEQKSIQKVNQIAENARQKLKHCFTERTQHIQKLVQELTEKLNKARMEDDFVETDLKLWSAEITKLQFDISTSVPISFQNIDDDLIQFVSPPYSRNNVEVPTNESWFTNANQTKTYYDTAEKFNLKSSRYEDEENSIVNTTISTRSTSGNERHPRIIELPKTSTRLGFVLSPTCRSNKISYISEVTPNGIAWYCGLKKGDQLLSVNGISVENEYHEKVVDLIMQARGSVKLVVRYSPELLVEAGSRSEDED